MRGQLDDRIARYKALAGKGPDGARNAEILARLYRAKGDLAAARDAAAKAGLAALEDDLLYEAGDWKELARRPVSDPTASELEKLGRHSAYRRLAGDAKGADEDLAALRKLADAAPPNDDQTRFYLARVLFLTDRPAEALEVLANVPDRLPAAFEILVARLDYRAALELADRPNLDADTATRLQILKARTLYTLGQKEKAQAIFARCGEQIKAGADFSWYETLIEAEARVGLRDEALGHAAKVLAVSNDQGWRPRLFAHLFPNEAETAEGLFQAAAQKRADPAVALRLTRDLLEGKAPEKAVADLIDGLDEAAKQPNARLDDLDRWRRALAEAALKAKQEDLARQCLEKAGSGPALMRLGDLAADKKEWDKAADLYWRAWEKSAEAERALPTALYLSGWALAKAGKEADGKKRMELAHWVPLGDDRARIAFLRGLAERGRFEAVSREGELLRRLSKPGSVEAAEGVRRLALDALDRKDYLAAADAQERSLLVCLHAFLSYSQPTAYVGVPAFVHRLRATGLATAGKFDDALREADAALAILPGDTTVPIAVVPELDKAGKKKEADELFGKCLAAQEKVCKDYPDCAGAHNNAAWLSACCRRELEKAQEHALKAVALTPDAAGCHDTLAEVCFQRGDKDKALAEEKKATELNPKRAYFRKQLKRIEAGDPAAPRPDEGDAGDDE
jgi:predicted Zn-dependent protease